MAGWPHSINRRAIAEALGLRSAALVDVVEFSVDSENGLIDGVKGMRAMHRTPMVEVTIRVRAPMEFLEGDPFSRGLGAQGSYDLHEDMKYMLIRNNYSKPLNVPMVQKIALPADEPKKPRDPMDDDLL